jgi:hypothetical protein
MNDDRNDRSTTDFDRGQQRCDAQRMPAPVDSFSGLTSDNHSDRGQMSADTQTTRAPVGSSATSGHDDPGTHYAAAAGGTSSPAGASMNPTPNASAPRPESIYDLIAENYDRFSHLDDAKIAERVIADGKIRPASLVFPLIVNAVASRRRAQTRRMEETAFAELRRGSRIARKIILSGTPAQTAFRNLSQLRFPAGKDDDKKVVWVTWGQATVAQHQARIDAMNAHKAGVEADVCRHAEAIQLCETAGVSCLDDLLAEQKGDAA